MGKIIQLSLAHNMLTLIIWKFDKTIKKMERVKFYPHKFLLSNEILPQHHSQQR